MSKCKYCGDEAGLFNDEHEECKQIFKDGQRKIINLAQSSIITGTEYSKIDDSIKEIAAKSFHSVSDIRSLLLYVWNYVIDKTFDEGLFSIEQEKTMLEILNFFDFSEPEIGDRYKTLVKSFVIRDLVEGKIPERVKTDGHLPFNFQKGEKLIWLFNPCVFSCVFYQSNTKTIRKGEYAGVSLKIMKGVYFRTGGFSSRPVTSGAVVLIAAGLLAVTDKHVYFYSPQKAFRIPYTKIIAFTPHDDGITIQKETKEKPFIFQTFDGWFTYNLLMNLSQR
jgi:hypothetical protein